jgi:hypothetical protein
MLNVIMLNVITLNVIMLNVIMLNVVYTQCRGAKKIYTVRLTKWDVDKMT